MKPQRNPLTVAAVLHELLKIESFECYADAKEALKRRCATLRLPYDAGVIDAAIAVVERTRPILPSLPARPSLERAETTRPISDDEACQLLDVIGAHFKIRLR